jgi:outer membrane protein
MRWIAMLCCFLAASFVSAKDLKIATVDLAKLFKEYPGTKAAQKKFTAMAERKKQDLTDSADELRDLKKQLDNSSSVLSSKQLRQKKQEYDRKAQNFAQQENQVQQDMQAKESEMTMSILDEIKVIVSGVAKDNSVDLVLDSEKTVYVKDGTDLTDQILKTFKKSDASKDDSGSKK